MFCFCLYLFMATLCTSVCPTVCTTLCTSVCPTVCTTLLKVFPSESEIIW